MSGHSLAKKKQRFLPGLIKKRLLSPPHARAMVALATLLSLTALPARAAESATDIFQLSLAQLGDIRVTSVSKKEERLADAAASVFVITSDDLRRSGANSLPEALRLAPNLHVAEGSAYGYAISARGFNSSSSNKLLVLIDGRSIYTPLFAGVFWDAQDLVMEDIDRIEVISGPGGTLWGTNAVNGVINIITRTAQNTLGTLLAVGAGNRQSDGVVRYGALLDNGLAYRIYSKYTDRPHSQTASGSPINDATHRTQVGFRADWNEARDQFSAQGNAYRGAENQAAPGAISISGVNIPLGLVYLSGANLAGRWERTLDAGARMSVQAYVDHTERNVVPTFAESLDIVDIQFQHDLPSLGMHSVVWGADYRGSRDSLVNSRYFAFLPAKFSQQWASLFAQDEMTLRDDLRFTVGARIERNDYTGREFLPSARLAWHLAPSQSAWGAISRAVRAPSRFDRDVYVPGTAPFLLDGGSQVRSELATVYELGYRGQTPAFSYSLAAFHTDYDHLRTQELAASRTSIVFASNMQGTTNGVEMWGTYQLSPAWRLNAGFTALKERLHLLPGSTDTAAAAGAGRDPAHKVVLRSSFVLSERRSLELTIRQLGALSSPAVPAYTAVDLRYAWQMRPNWELSVTGQNLVGAGHGEFTAVATRIQVERSVYVNIAARF